MIHQNHGRTDTNIHKHSQIGGYCEGFGKGTIRVGLVVGDCNGGWTGGNAYTGWNCISRIMIEEVAATTIATQPATQPNQLFPLI